MDDNSVKFLTSGATRLFETFGIQFFSHDSKWFLDKSPKGFRISHKQKLIFFVNFIIFTLQLSGVIFAIKLELHKTANMKFTAGAAVQFAAYLSGVAVLYITILNGITSRNKSTKIFRIFIKISRIFQSDFDEPIDYVSFAKKANNSVMKITLVYVASAVIMMVTLFQFNQSLMFFWAVLVIGPDFYFQVNFCHFMFNISLVRENLTAIHKILKKLYKRHKLTKVTINNLNVHNIVKKNPSSDELLVAIVKLKKVYGLLYDVTSHISDYTGVPLITQLSVIVLSNMASGYKFYLAFMGDIPLERLAGNFDCFKYRQIGIHSSCILAPFFTIFLTVGILSELVIKCSSTYAVSDEIFSMLSRFEFGRLERESGAQLAVSEFLLKLSHQPIKFTIAGFYTISKTFLASVSICDFLDSSQFYRSIS